MSKSIKVPSYIPKESFDYQISILNNEIPIKKLKIIRPCNINDGILKVSSFYKSLSKYNKNNFEDGSTFIPASGSATRMFNIDKKEVEILENIKYFQQNILRNIKIGEIPRHCFRGANQ